MATDLMSLISDKTSKAKENLKSILMWVGVALVSLSYPFYSILGLAPAEYTWTIITIKTIVGMVTGVLIKMGLGEIGYDFGYEVRYREQRKALKKLERLWMLDAFYNSPEFKKHKYFKVAYRKFCERNKIK